MISCISHFPLLILHYYSGFRRNARVLNPASLFSLLFFPRSVTNRSLVSTAHACGVIAKHMAKQDGGRSPKAGVALLLANMLKPHTNAHTVLGRPALDDVERFRSGSVRELAKRDHKLCDDVRVNPVATPRNKALNDQNEPVSDIN